MSSLQISNPAPVIFGSGFAHEKNFKEAITAESQSQRSHGLIRN